MKTCFNIVVCLTLFSVVYAQRVALQDSFALYLEKPLYREEIMSCNNEYLYLTNASQKILYRYPCQKISKNTKPDTVFRKGKVCGYYASFIANPSGLEGIIWARDSYFIKKYNSNLETISRIPVSRNTKYLPELFEKIVAGSKISEKLYAFAVSGGGGFMGIEWIRNVSYYKRRPHLMALYALKDSVYIQQKFLGKSADIYTQKLLPYLHNTHFAYTENPQKQIFISQEATYQIQLWDIETGTMRTIFGQKGKHVNPEYDEPKPWNKKIDNGRRINYKPELQKRIECTVYGNLYYEPQSHYLFRTYTIGKKDTVTHHVKTGKEWRAYKKKHKRFCSSAEPDVCMNQLKLELSKPYGLQIYNEKQELVYDELMPTPFAIFKIENDEIWVHGRYDEANKKYWIYKYKIELPKP